MKKLMFIFGTRPEFIKIYPLIMEAKKRKYNIISVNTGQHREMLDNIMNDFNFKPDYNLKIIDKSNNLTEILTNSLLGINQIILDTKPEAIFVHGDTSATLAGSIGAFYNKIKLIHIEAGLRTFDKYSPYPEEINRKITGCISDIHFSPTEETKQNLINENVPMENIHVVGNTSIDMMKYTITNKFDTQINEIANNKKIILLTAHRRENLEFLKYMFKAIDTLAEKYKDEFVIVYPIHLNPQIKVIADDYLLSNNIKIIKPLDVIEFHNLMKKSYLILTDSGGIQEEAPALNIPVLVMRDTTERPEGIKAGTLKLIGTQTKNIIDETSKIIDNKELYKTMANSKNPYGDGNTSQYIFDILERIK